jgi:hypothetical protein
MRRLGPLLVCTLATACTFGSEGASAGNSIGDGPTDNASDPSATSNDDDDDGVGTAGSASAGGSTSGPTATMTMPPDPDTGGDSTGPSVDDTGTSDEPVHVQHGDHGTCDLPMWCYWVPNYFDPAGGATAGQECFTSPIGPPFDVVSIDYIVAAVAPEMQTFSNEVYGSGGPTAQLATFPRNASDATVGPHTFVLPTPVTITDTRFCVGFRAPGPGLSGSLGVAVDTNSQIGPASWLSIPTCGAAEWSQIIGNSSPPGNWCIGADVVPVPRN